MSNEYTVEDQFTGTEPVVRAIYERLLATAAALGPVVEEPRKTCIHLSNGSAFAGVHTRRRHILVTLRTSEPINSPRVFKADRVSMNRFHQDIKLYSEEDVDSELAEWVRFAYMVSANMVAAT